MYVCKYLCISLLPITVLSYSLIRLAKKNTTMVTHYSLSHFVILDLNLKFMVIDIDS